MIALRLRWTLLYDEVDRGAKVVARRLQMEKQNTTKLEGLLIRREIAHSLEDQICKVTRVDCLGAEMG